ncbi:hypothetical protein AB6A40_009726 [Gnathostoma spinigerum]|uniref:Uncharacterized protein n=1 Tax=Gnathostoma spinigerum TaxID=75299 RepID=A0ABD6F1C6_9BILA
MSELPDEITDKIPEAPTFRSLPTEVKTTLKAITKERGISIREKFQKLQNYIASLPLNQRQLLAPPMFSTFTEETRDKLIALQQDSSLSEHERMIKAQMILARSMQKPKNPMLLNL